MMQPYDEPDLEDDYEDEDAASDSQIRVIDVDPLSEAIGARGYVDRFVIDDCFVTYPETRVAGMPERFDRFYFDAPGGPLLVDIVPEDGEPREDAERQKNVAFKRKWCREHDRRYIVIGETDGPERVRALLAGDEAEERPARKPAARKPAAKRAAPAKRGKVQRPKATA